MFYPNWAEEIFSEATKNLSFSFLSEQALKFLFAGNVGTAQDLSRIISAFSSTEIKNLNFQFVIAGGGRDLNNMIELVKLLNLETKIVFTGQLELDAMPSLYQECDILVLSLKDDYILNKTLPGKLQSYMLAGKPILSLANGEANNLITKCSAGLAANPSNINEIETAILDFMNMSLIERKKYGDNGKRYCLENFARKKMISRMENLIRTVGN